MNLYETLNIKPDSSIKEIRKAYLSLAKKYHPDKIRSDNTAMIKGAEEKFREVQKAYETLINK